MRPVLHPALSHTWRDESTLQVGVTPGLALVLGGLGPPERAILRGMTSGLDLAGLREVATEVGAAPGTVDRLLAVLFSAGAAIDGDDAAADEGAPDDDRRAPDRSSIGLQGRERDGGAAALDARSRLRVDVHGAGRVGAQVARLLAAAGVGEVVVLDAAPVRPCDVSPGGYGPGDVGLPRQRAAGQLVRRDAVVVSPTVPDGDGPRFAVLAPTDSTGRDEAADLVRHGVAHLLVRLVELTGIVGPLVIPGESSCLRCHDLHRTDRDPHWPLVLDQSMRRPPPRPAGDTALAAVVAGLAATQVLAHLDGFAAAAVDATLEVSLPGGVPRRRGWTRHPGCGCGWSGGGGAAQWVS
ncbi:ThiF family adenylyltransferase [Jiangella asiatica]|uniref:THIF-type NAD/FAD binding fold domain-containing protein n=1 Tax=Jiangella asiatica TaxID=2530372 RepID=A0A4R5DAI2_9ACTN|nr:hypothetical protein [Jiangella asiatica]TDE08791.1 hypothetical protein E1269_16645 [Jiangella asiatica]